MIIMLDTSQAFDECERDLGVAELGVTVEQLFTPLTRYRPQRPEHRFAIDNGAFSRFDRAGFESLLARELPRRDLCRWVAVPDVVGSARRTLEVFRTWSRRLDGWPIAFVCQDGQEYLPLPWGFIDAVFIGGSTEWKMSPYAEACIKAAQAIGKWVHVGRVNTPGRFEYFNDLGVDSIDGTGLSRYTHMREKIHRNHFEPCLFGEPQN